MSEGSQQPQAQLELNKPKSGELINSDTGVVMELNGRDEASYTDKFFYQFGKLVPTILFAADEAGRWLYVSDKWETLSKQPASSALGEGWKLNLGGPNRDNFLIDYTNAIRDHKPIDLKSDLTDREGSVTKVRFRAIPHSESTSNLRYVGTIEEIEDLGEYESPQSLGNLTDWVFDAMPHISWLADPNGLVYECNDHLINFASKDKSELLGKGILKIIHPDDRDVATSNAKAALKTGNRQQYDARFLGGDGAFRSHLVQLIPQVDKGNQVRGWLGTCTDIDDLQSAARELGESQRFLQRIGEASLDIIYLYDLKKRANIWANKSTFSMLGYSVQQIQEFGENLFTKLVHPDDFASVMQSHLDLNILADGDYLTTEYRMKSAVGAYVWIQSRDTIFERDEDGKPWITLGVAQDITERKHAELARSEHARILENSHDGIVRIVPSGALVFANSALETFLGIECGELIGREWHSIFVQEDHELVETALATSLEIGKGSTDARIVRSNGSTLFVNLSVVADRTLDAELAGYYLFIRDVQDQKIYENQIEEQIQELAETRVELELRQLELEDAYRALKKVANTDGLTQLTNHRSFQERLEEKLVAGEEVGLLLLDVDHFKSYNDSFGHPAGDALLYKLARILEEQAGDLGYAARYGGEEFAVVIWGGDVETTDRVAESIRSAIENTDWDHRQVTVSIGCTTSHQTHIRAELIAQSDQALYRAKRSGRNRVEFYAR